MAGKIVADTLEHSTAGSVTTDYVVNGSAKVWVDISGRASPVVDDSFNVSSLDDVGTGDRRINFTNSLSGTDYQPLAGMTLDPNTNGNRGASGHQLVSAGILSGSVNYKTYYGSTSSSDGGLTDLDHDGTAIFGDLA